MSLKILMYYIRKVVINLLRINVNTGVTCRLARIVMYTPKTLLRYMIEVES